MDNMPPHGTVDDVMLIETVEAAPMEIRTLDMEGMTTHPVLYLHCAGETLGDIANHTTGETLQTQCLELALTFAGARRLCALILNTLEQHEESPPAEAGGLSPQGPPEK